MPLLTAQYKRPFSQGFLYCAEEMDRFVIAFSDYSPLRAESHCSSVQSSFGRLSNQGVLIMASALRINKKTGYKPFFLFMAEREGFEPSIRD